MMCTLHCLAMPLLVVLLPSVIAVQLESEAFHLFLLIGVVPISLLSLLLGCRQHKQYKLLGVGVLGILFLVSAVLFETGHGHHHGEAAHNSHNELLEKAVTIIGSCIIAVGHFLNFRLCKKQKESCGCGSEK